MTTTDRVKIMCIPEWTHSARLLSTESMLTKLGLNLDLPKGSPDPPWNSALASKWPRQRPKTWKIQSYKSGSREVAWRLRPHFSPWSGTPSTLWRFGQSCSEINFRPKNVSFYPKKTVGLIFGVFGNMSGFSGKFDFSHFLLTAL